MDTKETFLAGVIILIAIILGGGLFSFIGSLTGILIVQQILSLIGIILFAWITLTKIIPKLVD